MDNQDLIIKPSFFDDPLPADGKIWQKGVPLKKPSEVRLMEGILFKRSGSSFNKSRYYVLFEDRLAYFKSARETKEQAYCLVQNMRLEKIHNDNEKENKYGIRLIHNIEYCEMYARAKDVQEKWVQELTRFCVLTNYSSSYVNIKAIGKGSFARVFLAKKRGGGEERAVKTFDKNLLLNADKARASLINEINIMRKLEQENIIKLYEVYESDNHIYLVLELLNGGELFDRIVKRGQYREQDACTLMKNLLSALAYMHSKGIMHRDLKPENLILKDNENDWDVKIADFGLSQIINCSEYLFKRCGTPGYVAPEILADEKYDEKVDVFSAGVILYILLSGGSPFHAKSYNKILWKNKNCEISYNFKEFGIRVSQPAIDLMKKMLTRDPKDRISASEALQHEWIISGGVSFSPRTQAPIYLSSAQDNMKKFQEENRFNVRKPKDAVDQNAMERASHAPSPLINGRVITVANSNNQFMSPDVRKGANGATMGNMGYFVGMPSPQVGSLGSTSGSPSDRSPISEEMRFVNSNLMGYNADQTLLSKLTEANVSTKSSVSNTPIIPKKANAKKALNVQETLLKYLGKTQKDAAATNKGDAAEINQV